MCTELQKQLGELSGETTQLAQENAKFSIIFTDQTGKIDGLTQMNTELTHMNADLTQMNTDLIQMNTELTEKSTELTQVNLDLVEKNAVLTFELANLKRMLFGASKEKFKPVAPNPQQLSLFDDEPQAKDEEQPQTQHIAYEREKPGKKHPGRNPIPEHFPVEETIIEPSEDVSGCPKIGEEITEYVEYTAAVLKKIRIIRPKYAKRDSQAGASGVVVAPLPSRALPKCLASTSLLAFILLRKFIEHMPFCRQTVAFKRDYRWDLSSSTINDWFVAVCTLLHPLYEELIRRVLQQGYLQVDESPLRVQESEKAKSTHQGYMWVYHCPLTKQLFFDYQPGRDYSGPAQLLAQFNGLLQSDGYKVYNKLAQDKNMTIAACLVHVRRKFFQALDNHKPLAEYALEKFRKIYVLEKGYKELSYEQRKESRLKHIFPLLEELKAEVEKQSGRITPNSPMGKAIAYFQAQWPRIVEIFNDGRYELDNNLIENKIRPLALGRKNYLFAGSHQAARRNAMFYSFFACCQAKDINPMEWLINTMDRIGDTKMNDLAKLLP